MRFFLKGHRVITFFTFLFILAGACITADEIDTIVKRINSQKGQYFPLKNKIEDQWGNPVQITDKTKFVIFMSDMDAKDKVHPLLQKQGKQFLEENHIIVMADIHKMPAIISSMLAKPRMRDYNYRLGLITEEETGKKLVSKKTYITVYRLENRITREIEIFRNIQEARAMLNY